MHKILLVDDDENILSGYKRNLRSFFEIFTANSPKAGLLLLKENKDFAVVVSDFKMPEMNGIEFLTKVKEINADTVRILLTGNAELNMAIKAVNEGNIFRFLTKPCGQDTLSGNIAKGIEQYNLVVAERELLEKTLRGSLKILIDILAMVSSDIFNKSLLYRNMGRKIVQRLGMQENWEIDIACLLSQIGTMGIPDEIIAKRKSGAALSLAEDELYYSQAGIGKDILKNIPRLENIALSISLQYKTANEISLMRALSADKAANARIIFTANMLKVLNDYFYYSGKFTDNNKSTLEELWEKRAEYDPAILGALEAELAGAEEGLLIKDLPLEELKKGMILAEDIYDRNNSVMLQKGMILSEINIIRMRNYSKLGGIANHVLVRGKNI